MSTYRDDQEAARLRISSLESKLAEREDELAAHKKEISDREQEIARLARELRTAGTARITPLRRPSAARFVVAGAMSAALVAGMIGFLSVRRAAPPPAVAAVTFADPPAGDVDFHQVIENVPATAPPLDTAAMRTAEEAQMRVLMSKVWSGQGSVPEIKMLKAICSHLENQECRERAAVLLAQKRLDDAR